MVQIMLLVHVNIPGVRMPGAAPRLNILNQGCVKVKTDHKVTIRNIKTFLGDRCCKKTVDNTFSEVHHRNNLLAERHMQISCISSFGANLVEVGLAEAQVC